MHYTLLFYQTPDEFDARTNPAKRQAFWSSFIPYMKAVKEAGIFVDGAGLEPPAEGATVRLRDGRPQVQDGPYAETKEQLGGLFVIDVPDRETAMQWARRYPAGNGGIVEVRPNGGPCNE